jgi:hypothetical protein
MHGASFADHHSYFIIHDSSLAGKKFLSGSEKLLLGYKKFLSCN